MTFQLITFILAFEKYRETDLVLEIFLKKMLNSILEY
jgi:hypothetical protein